MATHQSISGMSDAELVERMISSHDERYDQAFRDFFDAHVATHMPGRPAIADLGCGPGLFLRDLGRRFPGSTLYGYDLTPAMITYAEEEVRYAGPKPTLQVHDLTAETRAVAGRRTPPGQHDGHPAPARRTPAHARGSAPAARPGGHLFSQRLGARASDRVPRLAGRG